MRYLILGLLWCPYWVVSVHIGCTACKSDEFRSMKDHLCRRMRMKCDVGQYAKGSNGPTSTVTCHPCPYGYACMGQHTASPLYPYQFPSPHFIRWVTECVGGTYGVGINNGTHIATCLPCMHGYACTMISRAHTPHPPITGQSQFSASFPPFFEQEGVEQWKWSCQNGTYPHIGNTATTIASCEPCPNNHECPPSRASIYTGQFLSPPTIIPWTMECPVLTYALGQNTRWSSVQCAR